MNKLQPDILDCIGNTSLLALRNIVPENGARILLKLESENPTGSMKDRMALAMIEAAEADGRLTADGFVVEYTVIAALRLAEQLGPDSTIVTLCAIQE
jgi:cysteine synthase A